jgi:lysophospholipase L1-like esterase
MGKLFIISDSITAGAWDAQGGWANRLIGRIMDDTIKAEAAGNSFYCLPCNLGISGDTTAGLIQRFKSEIKARLGDDPDESAEIVFAIGVNDSMYLVDKNRPRFTDAQFRDNLDTLIDEAGEMAGRIAFVGLPPVDDCKVNPVPWARDKAYSCKRVKHFESIIESACADNDVRFLPLLDKWAAMTDYTFYLYDGVHPNTKGHALLAVQIGEFLLDDNFYAFHTCA